CYSTDSSGN
nr:immunoglobulin light chain junction region [Homo sapiens]